MCVFGHFLECVVFVWKYMWIFVFGLVLMNSGSDAKYTQGEWEHYKHKVKLQIMTTVTKPAVLYEFHFGNVLGFIYFHSQTILIHIYIYKELNTIRFSNLNGRKCDIPHLYIYIRLAIFLYKQTITINIYSSRNDIQLEFELSVVCVFLCSDTDDAIKYTTRFEATVTTRMRGATQRY